MHRRSLLAAPGLLLTGTAAAPTLLRTGTAAAPALLLGGTAAAPALLLGGTAAAQAPAWPGDRPIETIVPYPPGGGVDVLARIIMPLVVQNLGVEGAQAAKSIVSNRAGAGGQIGFEAVFNAPPDGWTLGAISAPALVSIPIERPVRYRAAEFTYLANVVDDPNAFYVRAESPLKSLRDLAAAARARPGTISYATTGVGSDDHLAVLAFQAAAGVPPMIHVPFPGAAPVLQAVLGGHVDLAAGNMSDAVTQTREGRTRYLGGAMTARWPVLPDVPTFREQGIDLVAGASRGIVGPPGLPDAIRTRLEAAFRAALADPAFLREAERQALPLRPLIGAAYRDYVTGMEGGLRALWAKHPWKE